MLDSVRKRISSVRKYADTLVPFEGGTPQRNHQLYGVAVIVTVFFTGLTLAITSRTADDISFSSVKQHYNYGLLVLVSVELGYWIYFTHSVRQNLHIPWATFKWRVSQDCCGFLCCAEVPEYKRDHVQSHLLYGCLFIALLSTLYYIWVSVRSVANFVCANQGIYELFGCLAYTFSITVHIWIQIGVAFLHRRGCSFAHSAIRLIAITWIVGLNLVIYFQTAIVDTRKSKSVKKGASFCTGQEGSKTNSFNNAIEQHHRNFIQPMGYALTVEFVVTMTALFASLWYHAKVREEKQRQEVAAKRRSQAAVHGVRRNSRFQVKAIRSQYKTRPHGVRQQGTTRTSDRSRSSAGSQRSKASGKSISFAKEGDSVHSDDSPQQQPPIFPSHSTSNGQFLVVPTSMINVSQKFQVLRRHSDSHATVFLTPLLPVPRCIPIHEHACNNTGHSDSIKGRLRRGVMRLRTFGGSSSNRRSVRVKRNPRNLPWIGMLLGLMMCVPLLATSSYNLNTKNTTFNSSLTSPYPVAAVSTMIATRIVVIFMVLFALACLRVLKPAPKLKMHEKTDLIVLYTTMTGILLLTAFGTSAVCYLTSGFRLRNIDTPLPLTAIEIVTNFIMCTLQTLLITKAFSTQSTRRDLTTKKVYMWTSSRRQIGKVITEIFMVLITYNLAVWIISALHEGRHSSLIDRAGLAFYPEVVWFTITQLAYPLSLSYMFSAVICLITLISKFATQYGKIGLKIRRVNSRNVTLSSAGNATDVPV